MSDSGLELNEWLILLLVVIALVPLVILDEKHNGDPPWHGFVKRVVEKLRSSAQRIRWIALSISLPVALLAPVVGHPYIHITAVVVIVAVLMLLPVYLILAIVTDYERRLRRLRRVGSYQKNDDRSSDAKEFARGNHASQLLRDARGRADMLRRMDNFNQRFRQ